MNKNEEFVAECIGYDADALGVCKDEGLVFFVKNIIRGEKARIVCTLMKKNYGYGKATAFLKSSEHRVLPKCECYKQCGGCQLQIMDAEEQAYFKEEKVRTCFRTIAKMQVQVEPIMAMEDPWRYRNKVQIPVQVNGDGIKMGFYRNHTNEIVEFDDCLVQTTLSNEITKTFKQLITGYQDNDSIRHLLIKHAHQSEEVMVVIVVSKWPIVGLETIVDGLTSKYPQIKSMVANVTASDNNVILGNEEHLLFGQPQITELLMGYKFLISSKSFFQINPIQTEKLYSTAIEYAKSIGNHTLLDLYCGTGTIGLLASKYFEHVFGVEIVKEAVEDANRNAQINDVKNIEFICADASMATKLIDRFKDIDCIIIDPPRKGCDVITLQTINEIHPKGIVYVSCSPSTLARDCVVLNEYGYEIRKVQPVDMFPQSSHVETVVLMTRKDQ